MQMTKYSDRICH